MIVEETGNLCSFYDGDDCTEMTFKDYKEAIKALNQKYLKMTNLSYRPTGEEIVDLINYVFSDYESCIVCKCKIELEDNGLGGKDLVYSVYGHYCNYYHGVWDSMLGYARQRNLKQAKLAKLTGNEKFHDDTYCSLKICGPTEQTALTGSMGRTPYERINNKPSIDDLTFEETVFKIKFKYDDMYFWLKEQCEQYLAIAKVNLKDYYDAEGIHYDLE